MDVNETRLQLLLGYEDWGNCSATADGTQWLRQRWEALSSQDSSSGIAWDQTSFELILQPYTFLLTDSPSHAHPHMDARRGAGRDRHGNWYWIDETEKELLYKTLHMSDPAHFWSARDGITYGMQSGSSNTPSFNELRLSGLTVTEDQYLVVGTLQPAGLLIFDLLAGGLPRYIFWPPTVPFAPFDLAPMPGGGAWILDRDNARYWALDRAFNVIHHDQQDLLLTPEQVDIFQPVDSGTLRHTTAQTFPAGISLQAISSIANGTAVAIEALPDGTVLILVSEPTEPFSQIYRYDFSKQLGTPVSTATVASLIEQDKKARFHLNGHDFAFIPEHRDSNNTMLPDRLYIVPQECNQVYAFNVQQDHDQLIIQPLPNYFPMRFFSGKRLVAAESQIYYDSSTVWLPLIEQRRPRYCTGATLYTPLGEPRHAFDGKTPGCVWHRLMLDASIPPETAVQIWSRAADDENELPMMHWYAEPALLLRSDGSELPFVEVERPVGEGNGTWELLFQSVCGRYLQLKITLVGNGRLTPRLRAMRIYYPRFSYLEQYLPAVYREDSRSASFLDRFLANFEGIYTTLEGKIAAAQMLFDARTAPPETLAWLASWLGIALNLSWNTNKQRFFIKHAMDFFRCRGTINGLLIMLQLAFDTRPGGPDESNLTDYLASRSRTNAIRIIEHFRTRYVPGVILGDPDDTNSTYYNKRWTPDQNSTALLQGYIHYLHEQEQQQGLDSSGTVAFPITAPDEPALQAAWEQFAQNTLGFIPRGVAFEQWSEQRHISPWQQFLERRYEDIETLNRAYQSHYNSFDEIELSPILPPDGPALWDWYHFETIVIPTCSTAHQFTVLLPLPASGTAMSHHRQLELARHIIEQEKPTHTVFEVKFYQAAFRIGTVRLGIDTLVDLGSRTHQLIAPMVLGQGYLLDTYLAEREPQDLLQREFLKH